MAFRRRGFINHGSTLTHSKQQEMLGQLEVPWKAVRDLTLIKVRTAHQSFWEAWGLGFGDSSFGSCLDMCYR